MLGPTGIECGAENRDLPCTDHPNAGQQNLVSREERWWRDAPGVFRGRNALIDDDRSCLNNCKSLCFFYSWLMDCESRLKTTWMSGLRVNMFPLLFHKQRMNKSTSHTSSVWRILMRGRRSPISYPELGGIYSKWQGMWLGTRNMIIYDSYLQEACQSWRRSQI
jgi:hypothetical protein